MRESPTATPATTTAAQSQVRARALGRRSAARIASAPSPATPSAAWPLGNDDEAGSGTAGATSGRSRSNQDLSSEVATFVPRSAAARNARSTQARSRTRTTAIATPSTVSPIQPPSHENGRAASSTACGRSAATRFATSTSSDASGSRSYVAARSRNSARPAPSNAHVPRRLGVLMLRRLLVDVHRRDDVVVQRDPRIEDDPVEVAVDLQRPRLSPHLVRAECVRPCKSPVEAHLGQLAHRARSESPLEVLAVLRVLLGGRQPRHPEELEIDLAGHRRGEMDAMRVSRMLLPDFD